MEYKVKKYDFNPYGPISEIEKSINDMAAAGWRVVSTTFMESKTYCIVVYEKAKD